MESLSEMYEYATVLTTDGDLLMYGGLTLLGLLAWLSLSYGRAREPAADRL